MSNFTFLADEWPDLHEPASRAEALIYPDPRAACFYARRSLELLVAWIFRHDGTLTIPYQSNLSTLIHEPSFRQLVGQGLFTKARLIKDLGNSAVHSKKPIREIDALMATQELFHFAFWLARTYALQSPPPDTMTFDPNRLPRASAIAPQTAAQLKQLAEQLAEKDAKLTALLLDQEAMNEELKELRAAIAAAKQSNIIRPDTHDYSEAQTRDYFIDLLLREAGWPLDKPQDREYPVTGMPNTQGQGFVDYVLWGDDGKPLAVVEAKRTKKDPRTGQQQAKLYADCLEAQYGQRPLILYTNGYVHWLWDDRRYPPRRVQGFFKKDELELMIQRRQTRQSIVQAPINEEIAGRYYQTRAIRRTAETFENLHERKALLVMATGSGKTRTVIALCDLLMRCNWVKRLLFLADRTALVNQALNAFKRHLPASSPVNLVTEKETPEARLCLSTYQTMMGLIDETREGERRFGVGHFDLIVIDEAHRSVYQKYRAIFDYFDSFLVGLTATPREEIDRNTYSLFELETKVPTDVYSLDQAIADGVLVPPKAISVPIKFQREGIKYDELSEEEKDEWDALEWEDGEAPDRVGAEAVNTWLFNQDTVDKVLETLMTQGLRVAGGDRLGKTIMFAKNHDHAVFIEERFNANYPHYKGAFARIIDYQTSYSQSLIDDFSQPDKPPYIAISVDMLDTGIDVPEVLNLIFYKQVRSKTKFWQMVGRGTRLCPHLHGPNGDKRSFLIFDYCQNLEYFNQQLEETKGASTPPLSKRLFTSRLDLIAALDLTSNGDAPHEADQELRSAIAERLRLEVAAMNRDNFIVRPKRQWVEQYTKPDVWQQLNLENFAQLQHEIAGLPSELEDDDLDAKQFDLLILNFQLAILRQDASFASLRNRVQKIAEALEEKANIPVVREQIEMIQELQTDLYWQGVTAPMLEQVRQRLRSLVKLIERKQREPVYTNFEDEIGELREVDLIRQGNYEQFKKKARDFLRAHEDRLVIYKLRWHKELTPTDLADLERILIEEGVGTSDDIQQAKELDFERFIRSLAGMNREAAKTAFGKFLSQYTLNSKQIEFIDLIVEHLTEKGMMEPQRLYEPPFTGFSALGVEGLFDDRQIDSICDVLGEINQYIAA